MLSRYLFVYLTFSMTLEEVIAGCEEAWEFFSGVFRVVVPEYVPRNISGFCARSRYVAGGGRPAVIPGMNG